MFAFSGLTFPGPLGHQRDFWGEIRSPKSLEKAPSVYPSGLPPSIFGYFKHR